MLCRQEGLLAKGGEYIEHHGHVTIAFQRYKQTSFPSIRRHSLPDLSSENSFGVSRM